MATYTATDYLLDRANIEDVITKISWYSDRQEWELVGSLFAENVIIDYTNLFGGKPAHISGPNQAKIWKGMLEYLDSTQHVVTGIITDLPQPTAGKSIEFPASVAASSNYLVTLKRSAAYGGSTFSTGGYYTIKLTRSTPDATGNPWRVSELKVHLCFQNGNTDVMKNPETKTGWF